MKNIFGSIFDIVKKIWQEWILVAFKVCYLSVLWEFIVLFAVEFIFELIIFFISCL